MAAPDRTAQIVDDALDPATGAVERADVAIAIGAAQHRDAPLVRALGALSEAADQPPAYAISGAVTALGLATGNAALARAGGRMLLAVTLAVAAKTVVKQAVARTRPYKVLDEGRYEVRALGPVEGAWNSFPSGHTADAVAMARALAREVPGAAWPAYGAAAAVALVQVPRGRHYPIDVAAGALIGWGAEALGDLAIRRAGALLDVPDVGWPEGTRP